MENVDSSIKDCLMKINIDHKSVVNSLNDISTTVNESTDRFINPYIIDNKDKCENSDTKERI